MRQIDTYTRCREIVDTPYSDERLGQWLDELEGLIASEIREEPMDNYIHVWQRDPESPLDVPFPYDELYPLYLEAKVLYANAELPMYQNAQIMFLDALERYRKWWKKEHSAVGGRIPTFL